MELPSFVGQPLTDHDSNDWNRSRRHWYHLHAIQVRLVHGVRHTQCTPWSLQEKAQHSWKL